MTVLDISKLEILIVEDNPHFRNLVRMILEAVGIGGIREARDGAEAIGILKNYQADLAILDWKMDGIDGIEFVRRIRAGGNNANRFLPIIMVTGQSEDNRVRQARQAGINDFLAKPISARSLMQRITSVLGSPPAFVQTGDYFGPDRRWSPGAAVTAERRREEKNQVTPGTLKPGTFKMENQ